MGFDCELTPVRGFVYRAEVGGGLLEHEYDHVFTGRHDADPVPDPSEVCEWRWQSPESVLAEVEAHPERFTPWFPLALRELIGNH
jgi:isopentenyl-diphosphate delta-isomerase